MFAYVLQNQSKMTLLTNLINQYIISIKNVDGEERCFCACGGSCKPLHIHSHVKSKRHVKWGSDRPTYPRPESCDSVSTHANDTSKKCSICHEDTVSFSTCTVCSKINCSECHECTKVPVGTCPSCKRPFSIYDDNFDFDLRNENISSVYDMFEEIPQTVDVMNMLNDPESNRNAIIQFENLFSKLSRSLGQIIHPPTIY